MRLTLPKCLEYATVDVGYRKMLTSTAVDVNI